MSTGYARMGGALVPTVPLYFSHYPAGGVLAKPADHLRLLMAMLDDGRHAAGRPGHGAGSGIDEVTG